MKIGIVAPAGPADHEIFDRVQALADTHFPGAVQLRMHPQCFLSSGHFAGDDNARCRALVDYANAPDLDAIWFARGGYGSNRIAADAIAQFGPAARRKLYLGYSDMGFLLAGLYRAGFAAVHGPMPADILREGGETAVCRALKYLLHRDPATLEPSLRADSKAVAFNMTVFSALLDTELMPDLTGHILMLEDVSEYLYRIDRTLFHITHNPMVRKVAGIRLGRIRDVPENDRPFGFSAQQIVTHWCQSSKIPFLGQADIGHDSGNKIVPFSGSAT